MKDISLWEQSGGPEKDQEFCALSVHLWGIPLGGGGIAFQLGLLFKHHHPLILFSLALLGSLPQLPQD